MGKLWRFKTSQSLLCPELSMLMLIVNILEYRFFCNVFKYGNSSFLSQCPKGKIFHRTHWELLQFKGTSQGLIPYSRAWVPSRTRRPHRWLLGKLFLSKWSYWHMSRPTTQVVACFSPDNILPCDIVTLSHTEEWQWFQGWQDMRGKAQHRQKF